MLNLTGNEMSKTMLANIEFSCFQTLRCCISNANKCKHYEHDKSHAQLIGHEKSFITWGPDLQQN